MVHGEIDFSADLVTALAAAFAAGAGVALLAQRRLVRRLNRLAWHDPLTGALNRRAFDAQLARELARAVRTGDRLSLALLDLDHFKRFNDRHGHQTGDRILRAVSGAATAVLREIDALGRYGGEEFALALPVCDVAGAQRALGRIRERMPGGVTFSAGVAEWDGTESLRHLVARADRAVYEAKLAGRDRTVVAQGATLVADLERSADAPARARRLVDSLAAQLAHDVASDARVLLSELVSDAVACGAGSAIRIELTLTPVILRAEVIDRGDDAAVGELDAIGSDGRWKLPLLADVADRWGVRERSDVVWFELRRRREEKAAGDRAAA